MNERDLNRFFLAIAPTQEQKDRVLCRVLQGDHTRSRSRKHPFVLAAVLIAVVAGLTALAAVFHWHEALIEYFQNPTQEQMESLDAAVNLPQATATDNGVTVRVMQTITDKHGIYVLYEVELPQEIQLTPEMMDKHLQWEKEGLHIEIEDTVQEDQDIQGMGTGGSKILTAQGNKLTILHRKGYNMTIANDQDISLSLENLCYYTDTKDGFSKNIIAECSFDISWDLNYADTTTTIDINKPVNITGSNKNTLSKIEISPISVWIFLEGDDVMTSTKPIINLTDGNSIELEVVNNFNTLYAFSSFRNGEDGGIISIAHYFDRITPLSDIESIQVGNLIVPIS